MIVCRDGKKNNFPEHCIIFNCCDLRTSAYYLFCRYDGVFQLVLECFQGLNFDSFCAFVFVSIPATMNVHHSVIPLP